MGIQGKPQPEFENMLENYINELIAIANFPTRLVFSRKNEAGEPGHERLRSEDERQRSASVLADP